MTRLHRSLAIAALAAALLSSPLSTSPASAATPTFADEFTAGPLNTGTWQVATPWGTQYNSREQQWYDPANFSFTGGGMRITTQRRTVNGYPYASGMITSRTKYSYGYYEIRAKLPKGKGVWPAFWLLADNYQEIDVFELLGDQPNKVYMTYHLNHNELYQATYTGPDFSAGYHTFAVDWQPTYIRWYIDGVKRGEYRGTIPATAQNIIANTAVGDSTSWPGAPDGTTTMPQYFDIDYIRAFPTMPEPSPVNQAPVGTADSYATNQDTALTFAAPGVLANDTDPEGTALAASVASQPAHGTLALSANGSFIYTPVAGYTGIDTFSYRASDGSLLSAATPVSVTVSAVNHAPVAAPDSFSAIQDTALSVAAPGLLANDTDPDGDAVSAVVVAQPAHGTLTVGADGSFVYTPAPGWSGTDDFTYQASDGSLLSATTRATITVDAVVAPPVNQAPIGTADPYVTNQDTALTLAAPGVLANDTDLEGAALTASLATRPAHGTLALSANGSFIYTPAAGWSGTDSFTYQASDGSLLSAATAVTITVKAPATPRTHGRSHWRVRTATARYLRFFQ